MLGGRQVWLAKHNAAVVLGCTVFSAERMSSKGGKEGVLYSRWTILNIANAVITGRVKSSAMVMMMTMTMVAWATGDNEVSGLSAMVACS